MTIREYLLTIEDKISDTGVLSDFNFYLKFKDGTITNNKRVIFIWLAIPVDNCDFNIALSSNIDDSLSVNHTNIEKSINSFYFDQYYRLIQNSL